MAAFECWRMGSLTTNQPPTTLILTNVIPFRRRRAIPSSLPQTYIARHEHTTSRSPPRNPQLANAGTASGRADLRDEELWYDRRSQRALVLRRSRRAGRAPGGEWRRKDDGHPLAPRPGEAGKGAGARLRGRSPRPAHSDAYRSHAAGGSRARDAARGRAHRPLLELLPRPATAARRHRGGVVTWARGAAVRRAVRRSETACAVRVGHLRESIAADAR